MLGLNVSNNNWRLPSLTELTPMLFNTGLTPIVFLNIIKIKSVKNECRVCLIYYVNPGIYKKD